MNEAKRILRGLHRRMLRFRPRRFQAYCVGAAKTGTTTVGEMFSFAYRSVHEAEAQRTNHLVIQHLEGQIGETELEAILRERDRRLHLEIESAHPLGYLAGTLARIFPDSRFIVTIREPLSWLRSRLNYHYKAKPPEWEEYRDYFWVHRQKEYAPEEAPLQRFGLCSLDIYLGQYADHYARVFASVPEARRITVRTSEINPRAAELARFVGADPSRVRPSHSKRSDNQIDPLSEMDEAFVKERVLHHCRPLIEEFFPEKLASYEAMPQTRA